MIYDLCPVKMDAADALQVAADSLTECSVCTPRVASGTHSSDSSHILLRTNFR